MSEGAPSPGHLHVIRRGGDFLTIKAEIRRQGCECRVVISLAFRPTVRQVGFFVPTVDLDLRFQEFALIGKFVHLGFVE